MNKDKEILIVGAGPSGLSMSIFLSELGYKPRIIDEKNRIDDHSKALGVNPRTLEIFNSYGITDRFLANGRKMKAVNLWIADRHIYKNDFNKIKHQYPFMLIQPQKESEEILLEEAQKRNINVEYNTEFLTYSKFDSHYSISLKSQEKETKNYDYIIGADGAHSQVREQMGVKNKGFQYDGVWELYDLELDMDLDKDEGHIRVFPDGGMLMIRLKDNIWRVAGSKESLLNYLPKNTKIGKINWESKFRIYHRIVKSLTSKNAVLIGDAAHLHSPAGARGMNLGIEDAFISSQLLHDNKLNEYDKLRRPYLTKIVKRINNITMGISGNSIISKIVRSQLANLRIFFPIVMPRVRDFVIGVK